MSKTVMIIDDSLFMRNVMTGILVEKGFKVIAEAASGIEAMRILHDHKPEFILLDVILPDANGIDLILSIKSISPQSQVVICSSLGEDSTGKKALDHGAVAFIHKPFTREKVYEVLETLEK